MPGVGNVYAGAQSCPGPRTHSPPSPPTGAAFIHGSAITYLLYSTFTVLLCVEIHKHHCATIAYSIQDNNVLHRLVAQE